MADSEWVASPAGRNSKFGLFGQFFMAVAAALFAQRITEKKKTVKTTITRDDGSVETIEVTQR